MMTLEKQLERFKSRLKTKLKQAALILEGEYHNIVAIDTGTLNQSITTGDVIDRGNILSVDVGSEGVFYAVFVDQGVKGAVYNYHRRSGASRPVVWVGHGQHYMERGLSNKLGEIKEKILEARIS